MPEFATINAALSSRYEACLTSIIDTAMPTAVLDFPDYGNVGDSAIWAGQVRLLERLGCRINYVSDIFFYREEVLRGRMAFGQVLLNGGGNFGTVWTENQAWREAVIERLRDYRVIQLPQTLQFSNERSLQRLAKRIAAHPDFTLMARDKRSEAVARDQLGANTVLCTDAAFMLHGTLHRRPPRVDVQVLARSDKEAAGGGLHALQVPGRSVECADWLDEPDSSARSRARWVKRIASTGLGRIGKVQRLQWRLLNALADERIARGVEILSRGRIVITDRLHAHILCTLLGIPHVVLDNNYGKIHDFINCWHPDHPLVHMARSTDEAIAKAQSLLEAL